ncbi:hypothetical protein [Actinoplanes sp. NPDC051859]|uniref:hypothetical protein n=1 Tax=Actinoplanes sp. NPDC051859 TaxID=3363909 RepID=UPI0037AC1C5C
MAACEQVSGAIWAATDVGGNTKEITRFAPLLDSDRRSTRPVNTADALEPSGTEANSWLGSGYNTSSAAGAALCRLLITHTTTTTIVVLCTGIAALDAAGNLRLPPLHASNQNSATVDTALR